MSITLYFSKVNINSHIYDVYEDKKVFDGIVKDLSIKIKDNISIENEVTGFDSEGNEYHRSTTYKFYSIEKLNELPFTITGRVLKKMTIFINDLNEETGEIIKRPTENTEVIDFFYDISKEIVAFHTSNRFGYADFNEAFKGLINKSMSDEKEEYYFEVSLWREGLKLDEIKNQLKKIGKLVSLRIEVIPPNPDDDLLNNIQDNGEEFINDFKEGNVTHRSILFDSTAPEGLNIDSNLIDKELNQIGKIHSTLSSEEATRKGYVSIDAVNNNGRSYTTDNSKPVKDRLESKPPTQQKFAKICKRKINALINSFL
ncbi:hypothetical protein EQV77_00740 [Halobacillus fulvus]|nr:hypothetical protein EQV77_00740 [Halobacillus fulvus]